MKCEIRVLSTSFSRNTNNDDTAYGRENLNMDINISLEKFLIDMYWKNFVTMVSINICAKFPAIKAKKRASD